MYRAGRWPRRPRAGSAAGVPAARGAPAALAAAERARPSDRQVHELTGLVGSRRTCLLPPGQAAGRGAGLGAAQLGRPPRRLLHRRPGPLRRAAGGDRRRPCIPGLRLTPPPPPSTGGAPGGAGAGAVPVHRQQRPLADGRGPRRARSGGAVEARSAGSHPKPLHPNAVRVMRDEHGIDLAGQRSKHLGVFAQRALRPGDQPVRPGARGVPRVPRPARADPLEHPRPGARAGDADDAATRPSSRRPPSWRPASGSCSR